MENLDTDDEVGRVNCKFVTCSYHVGTGRDELTEHDPINRLITGRGGQRSLVREKRCHGQISKLWHQRVQI